MIPLTVIPGIGTGTIVMGAIIFVTLLIGTIGVMYWKFRDTGEPWDDLADAMATLVDSEDADAAVLIPYSDGPMLFKPGIYDREMMGGKGGYRTPDGDKIYVDGQGNGTFNFLGVDVVLAIDPTEHAAAADPIKAHIAYKNNELGEWIKVDREGNLIEAGAGLKRVHDDVDPAMETSMEENAAADGGHVSEVHALAAEEGMEIEEALELMEQEDGLIHKIVDVAPPREAVVDEATGEVRVDEATHVTVDVSSAADLLPKKTTTAAWNLVEEKARQEGRDEEARMERDIVMIVVGGLIGGGVGVVMALIFAFT